jgi:tetratricopeptide (TPR) repeat protein
MKSKTKKLGKITAIIHYRTSYSHGFNQNKTRAKREFDQYFPLLCEILEEIRFVSKYTLWHVSSNRLDVSGIRLMGTTPTYREINFDRNGLNPSISPLFQINDSSGEILPLYAFFEVEKSDDIGLPEIGKDVFVFNGNTKNTVLYLSTTGEHLEKSIRFQHWKELLFQKQLNVTSVNPKKLTIEGLNAIGKHISSTGIQALVSSSKYLREASIQRPDLNEMLDSFSFSSYNGFVLGGESGIGKSTLLAQKTEEWISQGHMVSFYRASLFLQPDIGQKFLGDCSLRNYFFEDFLSLVNPIFTKEEKKCYLIIDALNEYTGNINELINHIEIIVLQAKNFPWFKLIVSVRDSSYNRTISKFGDQAKESYYSIEEEKPNGKERTNFIRLMPISQEFVENIYNAYREFKQKDFDDPDSEGNYKFRPLTTFKELDPHGKTIILLRNPVLARIIFQTFHRTKLPQNLDSIQAMQLYYDSVILEKSDNSLGFPERNKFLKLLVTEFDKNSIERIERDEIFKNAKLQIFLIGTKKDSTYDQLLELGVLMEEWEEDNCYVRFAFDKFFEFLLTEIHWSKITNDKELLELCKRALDYKPLVGVCETITLRFCLNNENEPFINLVKQEEELSENSKNLIKEIAVKSLLNLANENYNIFEQTIDKFLHAPKKSDLIILKKLIETFYLTGNIQAFEKTLTIAFEESNQLNDKMTNSDLMLLSAQLDLLQGRYPEARIKIENSIIQKEELNDIHGELIGKRKLGALEWRLGNIEKAEKIWKEALKISKKFNKIEITGSLLNNLGIILFHKGKLNNAEKLYLEALNIRKKIGDKKGIAESLMSLGGQFEKRNEISQAQKLYLEAIEIMKELGDKKGIANNLNNLGNIEEYKGEYDKAEKIHLEALEIMKKLGDKRGIANNLNNLGNILEHKGEYNKAEKIYLESLEIKKILNDKIGIAVCLNNLGNVFKYKGQLDKAEKRYIESLEIFREVGFKNHIEMSLNNLGQIYKQKGELEKSEKLYLEALEISKELNDKKSIYINQINLEMLLEKKNKLAMEKK